MIRQKIRSSTDIAVALSPYFRVSADWLLGLTNICNDENRSEEENKQS